MKDNKTLAYINMHAIFGALPTLAEQVPEVAALANPAKPVSLKWTVKDGPTAVLTFEGGRISIINEDAPAGIKCAIASCEKFNDVVDGKATPIPSPLLPGVIKFMTKNFTQITDILSKYLRADPAEVKANRELFEKSTIIMFNLIMRAIVAIGNYDKIGRLSASRIKDGTIAIGIEDVGLYACIDCKDHVLSCRMEKAEKPNAKMMFDTLDTARGLFDGELDAIGCMGLGKIRIGGFIPMIDNVNRILNRVAVYLA